MPKAPEILLITPRFDGVTGDKPLAPSLGPLAVAALTPPEIQVSFTDENLDPVDFDQPVDLVGIGAATHTVTRAYQLADAFRARGKKVVMGGIHPSALPVEALQHADAVVVGEAENVWAELLNDLQRERLQKIYHSSKRPNLESLPCPRRDLLKRNGYIFPDTVSTTRGCPNGCKFCAVTSFYGQTYRSRPTEEVLAEAGTLQGKTVFFVDDNIAGHRGRAGRLFKGLAEKKLIWIGQASVSIARDESLLESAAASGCLALFLGFESLSPASLKGAGKHCNKVEEYEEAIKRIHSHGIAIFGAFIFGLDPDTEDTFEQTLQFAKHNRLEGAQFNILTPYPGTPLFTNMEKAGRLLHKDWNKYHADNVVFKPTCMSTERLKEGRDWTEREFFRLSSIWERIGPRHPHLLAMWALNLIYRHDFLSQSILRTLLPLAKRLL